MINIDPGVEEYVEMSTEACSKTAAARSSLTFEAAANWFTKYVSVLKSFVFTNIYEFVGLSSH